MLASNFTSVTPHSAYMKLSASQTSLNSLTPGSFTKERLAGGVYLDNRPFVAYRQMKELTAFPHARPTLDGAFNRCSSQLKIFVKGERNENDHGEYVFEIPSSFDVNKFTQFQAYCRGFLARMRFQHRKKRNDSVLIIQKNAEVFVDCSKDRWFQLLWSLRPIINAKFTEEEFNKLKEELETKVSEIHALTSENYCYKQEIHRLEALLDEHDIVPANDFRFLKIDHLNDKNFQSQQVGLLNEEFHEKESKLIHKESEEKIASQKEQIKQLNDQIKELMGSPDERSRLEAEIAQLKHVKNEQTKQIARLESFMEEYDELSQELKSTKERVKRLRNQLTNQQSEHENELSSLRSQWQKRMESLQEQLEIETEAKDKLMRSNRELEKKLDEAKSRISEDTEEISDSHVSEDVRMRKELLQTKMELEKVRADYEAYQADNNGDELKQRISELESNLEAVQRDKDAIIGDNAVLKVKLENISTSLEETENRHKSILKEKSKRLSEKKSELIEAQKKIMELETLNNKQSHEISISEQNCKQLEAELRKMKIHGSDSEPASPISLAENLEKDQTISRLDHRIKTLEAEKDKVQEALDETLEEMENLQREYDESQETINQERIKIRKLKQKLAEYQERTDNAEMRLAQSERRRTDLSEDLDRANKALEEARAEIAELHAEVAHLQRFHMTSGSLRRHGSMRSLQHQHTHPQSSGDHTSGSHLNIPSIDVQDCSGGSSSEEEEELERMDNIMGLSSGNSLSDMVRQNELLCQADRLISKGKRDRRTATDLNTESLSRSQSFRQISSLPKHMTGGSSLQRTHSFQEGINKKTKDPKVTEESEH